jgi:hypothetical protein
MHFFNPLIQDYINYTWENSCHMSFYVINLGSFSRHIMVMMTIANFLPHIFSDHGLSNLITIYTVIGIYTDPNI